MMKWIRTSRLSIKNSLSEADQFGALSRLVDDEGVLPQERAVRVLVEIEPITHLR